MVAENPKFWRRISLTLEERENFKKTMQIIKTH